METQDIFKKLKEPFPVEEIDWRVGSTNADKTRGIAVAYIQARPVMDRLDETLGPDNWQDAYEPILGNAGPVGFKCSLSLRINGEWITKTDAADTSDIEAIKGGVSDALKRAAVKWGIGRYLYDLPNTWVELEPRGKSYAMKQTPKLPAWALPAPNGKSQDPYPMVVIDEPVKAGPDPIEAAPTKEVQGGTRSTKNSTPKPTVTNKWKRPMAPEILREALQIKAEKAKPATESQFKLAKILLIEHFGEREDERRQALEYLTGSKSTKDLKPEMTSAILDWMNPTPDEGGAYQMDPMSKKELNSVAAKQMETLGQEPIF